MQLNQSSTFGPILWQNAHLIAANYEKNSEKDKRAYYLNYFVVFGKLIPCQWCRFYYDEICKLMPLESFIDQPNGVQWWLYLVHDLVNKKNQFKENLCVEACQCSTENCRYRCKRTVSSPPFQVVLAFYDKAGVTHDLKKPNSI